MKGIEPKIGTVNDLSKAEWEIIDKHISEKISRKQILDVSWGDIPKTR